MKKRDFIPQDDQARLTYQLQLFDAFAPIAAEVKRQIVGRPVFLPPLNGGDLIRAFFQTYGVIKDPNDVITVELKRNLFEDGRLMVGAIESYYPQGDFATGVIIDDCIATDVSSYVGLRLLKEKYPQIRRFIVAVSAATQRGLEAIERDWIKADLNIVAAVPVFKMNKDYYLQRTRQERYLPDTYFVGDMGKWAKPLPPRYNEVASWNNLR